MESITTADLADFYRAGLQRGLREGAEVAYCIGGAEFDLDAVLEIIDEGIDAGELRA